MLAEKGKYPELRIPVEFDRIQVELYRIQVEFDRIRVEFYRTRVEIDRI